jgi:hypothetical protein
MLVVLILVAEAPFSTKGGSASLVGDHVEPASAPVSDPPNDDEEIISGMYW